MHYKKYVHWIKKNETLPAGRFYCGYSSFCAKSSTDRDKVTCPKCRRLLDLNVADFVATGYEAGRNSAKMFEKMRLEAEEARRLGFPVPIRVEKASSGELGVGSGELPAEPENNNSPCSSVASVVKNEQEVKPPGCIPPAFILTRKDTADWPDFQNEQMNEPFTYAQSRLQALEGWDIKQIDDETLQRVRKLAEPVCQKIYEELVNAMLMICGATKGVNYPTSWPPKDKPNEQAKS